MIQCDIVTVNGPSHESTKGLINPDLLRHFKKVRPSLPAYTCLNHTAKPGRLARQHDTRRYQRQKRHRRGGEEWTIARQVNQPNPVHVKLQPTRVFTIVGCSGYVDDAQDPQLLTAGAQQRYVEDAGRLLGNYLAGKPQERENVVVGALVSFT